jgi:hypothetical protein
MCGGEAEAEVRRGSDNVSYDSTDIMRVTRERPHETLIYLLFQDLLGLW